VLNQDVTRLLTRPVYAGYVAAPRWDVSLRKGHHEALVSFETYRKIQDRLAGHAKVPARKNLSQDFPLRGFVTCADCGTPLTACWTTGCRARYAYYLCPKHGCPSYRKSVRRELLEGQFESLLRQLQPSENLFCAVRAMIQDLWDHRVEAAHGRAQSLKAALPQVERKIEQLLDRVTEADVASVIRAYEERIRKLEEQKAEIVEQIASCGRPVRSFDETVRTALDFLGNPWKLWTSERLEDKRTVLKLAFVERLVYARNEGFRTTNVALPFKALAQIARGEIEMARPERFELPTTAFEARYSIQLSYGRAENHQTTVVVTPWSLRLRCGNPHSPKCLIAQPKPARFEPSLDFFEAEYSIQLSYGRTNDRLSHRARELPRRSFRLRHRRLECAGAFASPVPPPHPTLAACLDTARRCMTAL
jgi:site-specific DNA recombinase